MRSTEKQVRITFSFEIHSHIFNLILTRSTHSKFINDLITSFTYLLQVRLQILYTQIE